MSKVGTRFMKLDHDHIYTNFYLVSKNVLQYLVIVLWFTTITLETDDCWRIDFSQF